MLNCARADCFTSARRVVGAAVLMVAAQLSPAVMEMAVPGVVQGVAVAEEAPVAPDQPQAAREGANAGGEGEGSDAVIPAGQEDLLADMLGRGATLPGQCKLAGAQVDRSIVKSTYSCPSGEVVFELRHPSTAPSSATRTTQFAIALESGSPPAGLADALVGLIRVRESAFEWKLLQPPPAPRRSSGMVVVGLLGSGVLLWILFRRWRALAKA